MGFRVNVDDLQELAVRCDADGIVIDWNRAAEVVTGFTRAQIVGYHVDSIVTPGSRAELAEILSMHRAGSQLPPMPIRLQTSFGMEVHAEVTSVQRVSRGKFDGWLLLFRDTTLQVQLREHLDRLDTLYRSLVDCSPAIIYVLDPHGKVVFINNTVETLLGYAKSELLGREMIDIVHPDDREHAYWPLRERRRFPRAVRNLEIRLTTKGGAYRRYEMDYVHVELTAVGLWGEGQRDAGLEQLGTQGIARDITELVMLRDFSRQVEIILPICSVCRKIRARTAAGEEWIPLDTYISMKTDTLFSHTYCPDHIPRET